MNSVTIGSAKSDENFCNFAPFLIHLINIRRWSPEEHFYKIIMQSDKRIQKRIILNIDNVPLTESTSYN